MYAQYTNQAAYGAGSEGANLEYSILSAILGNSPEPTSQGGTGSPTINPAVPSTNYPAPSNASNMVSTRWPSDAYAGSAQPATSYASSTGAGPSNYAEQAQLGMQSSASNPPLAAAQALASEYNGYSSTGFTPGQGSPPSLNVPGQQPAPVTYDYTAPATAQAAPSSPTQRFAPYAQRAQAVGASIPGAMRAERGVAWASQSGVSAGSALAAGAQTGAKVYEAVTKPYDYTEGYHFLMKHLPTRCVARLWVLAASRAGDAEVWMWLPVGSRRTIFCASCARWRSSGLPSSRCRCHSPRRTRCSWRSVSNAPSSCVHRGLFGVSHF